MALLSSRLRALLMRMATWTVPRAEREIVRGDLEEWYEARVARGRWSARRQLLIELLGIPLRSFPGVSLNIREAVVRLMVRSFVRDLFIDLRYYARRVRRSPATMVGSVTIMSLAIGGALVVLAVFRTLLWPAPGIPNPERVLVLERVFPVGNSPQLPATAARAIQHAVPVRFTEYGTRGVAVRHRGVTRRLLANLVSDDFFSLMGVAPVLGRAFGPRRPGDVEVVISHAIWQSMFDGSIDVLGTVIGIDRAPATIVGVAPGSFRGPAGNRPPALWYSTDDVIGEQMAFGGRVQLLVAQTADGIPVADALWEVLQAEDAEAAGRFSLVWTPLPETLGSGGGERGFVVQSMVVASVLAGLVLVVACTNVASALLADGLRRRGEFALRSAVGASRPRLVRQLLTESVILTGVATGLGAVGGWWALSVLPRWLPTPFDGTTMVFSLRGADLAIAALLAAMVAAAAGLIPAVRVSKPKDQRIAGATKRGSLRTGETLVVGQVAFSVAAAVISALLMSHIGGLRDAALGYDDERRLAFPLQFDDRYGGEERRAAVNRLLADLQTTAGIRSVALLSAPPFVAFHPWAPLSSTTPSDTTLLVSVLSADANYFRTMNAGVVAGRTFRPVPGDGREIVIGQAIARELFSGGESVGQALYLNGEDVPYDVVGIVADGTYGSRDTIPMVFVDLRRAVPRRVEVLMYVDGSSDVGVDVAAALGGIDPDLAVPTPYPVAEWFERAWVLERAVGDLSKVLTVIALVISGFGLFAFFSRLVADRTREIGIRRALGASSQRVMVALWRRSVVIIAVGFVAGSLLAWGGGRLLSSVIVDVAAGQPSAYAAVFALILGIATVATVVPLRHASAVDPLVAMRE